MHPPALLPPTFSPDGENRTESEKEDVVDILRTGMIKKTRKPHMCCGCDEPIPVGSACRFQVNTFDGLGTSYWHDSDECEKAACEEV